MIIICIRNMYQLPIPSGLKIVTCKKMHMKIKNT